MDCFEGLFRFSLRRIGEFSALNIDRRISFVNLTGEYLSPDQRNRLLNEIIDALARFPLLLNEMIEKFVSFLLW